MIDADPQPSLSSYYKILEQAQGGLTEILTDPQNVNSCISKTQYGDLIYSNDHSNQLQPWLASKGDGRFRLKIAINKLVEEYDYILIDTQGAKGNLQDAAVLAADILISPMPLVLLCVRPAIPCITRVFKWLTITLLDFALVKEYLVMLFIALLPLKLTLRLQLHFFVLLIVVF
jgi:chromosome partitioning related protein ParA